VGINDPIGPASDRECFLDFTARHVHEAGELAPVLHYKAVLSDSPLHFTTWESVVSRDEVPNSRLERFTPRSHLLPRVFSEVRQPDVQEWVERLHPEVRKSHWPVFIVAAAAQLPAIGQADDEKVTF
jgi:hypothetical protein